MINTYFCKTANPGLQISKVANRIKIGLLAFVFVAFGLNSNAQVSLYSFTQSAGTYTPITGGNILGTATVDDDVYTNLPIGFPFFYNGASYTAFGLNANGWITFGPGAVTSSYTSLSSGTNNNVIAGFNSDLQSNPNAGELSYKTIGTAPNRVLVVQWKNFDHFSSTTNNDNYNFQIRLSETSNQIEVVYGTYTKDATVYGMQVGLRGATAADFNNREVINGVSTWATSTAGALNTAGCEVNNTPLLPTSGQTYTWAPPAGPTSPSTLTFTAVTTSAMTLNWLDNSTDELSFQIFRSTDNVNFTFAGSVASTSTATTATPYTFPATGLFSNTLYYWKVYALNAASASIPLTGQQTTLPGTLCGTITVGPTGTYPSLTAAFAATVTNGLSCPVIFELQAAYVSTVETFPLVVPFMGASSVNTITVRPMMGASNLSITSASTQTVDFSGSSYTTFDGRPGGIGTLSQLTLDNTSLTGNAVRFTNDANTCGLNYINVRGVTTGTTTGVVAFGNAISAGNNNCFITNSDLTSGLTSAQILIFATNTTAGTTTSGVNISNNKFYNWFNAASVTSAISVAGQNASWTISNNSFYQTASRTFTAATVNNAILVNMTVQATGNFTISNNQIGGSAANCGGSAWTDLGAVAHRFVGINVTTGLLGPNVISGNTITNFNYSSTASTTTGSGNWAGISVAGTIANYTISANTIGSNTVNGVITTSSTVSGGLIVGINSSATGNNVNITVNIIGGITANTSGIAVSSSITGIQSSSGTNTITGNIIGSVTQNNSFITAISTSATAGIVTGINCTSTISAIQNISNNTIANLSNQYGGTSTAGQTRGIVTTGGTPLINVNNIQALANLAPQTGTTTSASVIGITQQSTSTNGNIIVSNNHIRGLANGSATGNVSVTGIIVTGPSTLFFNSSVFGNEIGALAASPLNPGTPIINGIFVNGGIFRVYNNMVSIGTDALGGSLTASHEYNGIYKATSNRTSILFNSVLVAGTGVNAGTANSNAYRRTANPAALPADSLYNNIFSNTRSNGTSTGFNYSANINANTNLVGNGNVYYGNGTGYVCGLIGATPYASLAAYAGAIPGQDINSFAVDPMFTSNTNLHINNATMTALESRAIVGMNINTDYDSQVRPGPTGSVNGGATAPDIGADEFDGIPVNVDIGITQLVLPATSGCHSNCEIVRVRLKNQSSTSLDMGANNVTITASTTGPNPQTFPFLVITSGIIPGLGTIDTAVTMCYDMSAVGTHVFNASASTPFDFITSNNAMAPVSIYIGPGVTTVSPASMCLGSTSTLSVVGQTNGGTIQWQESVDNITWTNVSGATTTPYVITPTLDTTWYRAQVCGTYNSNSDTSRTIFVTPATTVGGTRCGAGPVTLTAAGSGTLNWYDAPALGNLVNTGTTYTPTVSATTTYYVENSTGTPSGLHTTTYANNNGSSGNTFTIKALNTITITSFDGHTSTTAPGNWEVWYRPNDYLLTPGSHLSNVGWTQLGTATNVPQLGTGLVTPIPINFNVTIPAGQTYSFMVFNNGGVNYTNGTVLGALYNANADLEVYQGHGGTSFAGMVNSPRVFNGRIHYSAGCSSARTPVIATVTAAPAITATAANQSLCGSDSTQFNVSSVNSTYAYTWTPATYLSSTTIANPMFVPTAAGTYTYYVDAFDSGSGCSIRDTVTVSSSPRPSFTIAASNDTICSGSTISLNAVLPPPPTSQISNSNVLNTSTTYPAPYGNWYGGARHQMLILASEMNAVGLTSGYIGGLTFQVNNTNAADPLQNFTISLGMTNVTALTSTFEVSPMTTVYTNSSYAPTVGVNTHTFSTPFFWDGISNIIVETCFLNATGPTTTSFTNNATMRQVTTSFASTNYYFADNQMNICSNTTGTIINQRPNIGFIHSYTGLNYAWTPAATLATPTADTTLATPTTTTTYYLNVTDSNTGCSKMDSIRIVVNPTPAPMLGADTAICSNTVLTLDASAGPYNYLWSDLSTNQTLPVNAFGNYDVLVTDSLTGCAGRDTILVGINAAPAFSLGADVVICAGNNVTFSGPSGTYNYNWSNADTTQTITTGAAASYVLVVTDTINACFNSDTVALTVNALPVVALGADYAICSANAPTSLYAPLGAYTYLWSDASTIDSLNVNATGTYYVVVTDIATTCYSGDTIAITVNSSPVVSLGVDSTFCSASGPITLTGPTGPFDYLWSDATTAISLTTNTSGNYYLTVTDSVTGCATADTVIVTVNASPVVNLGADTTLCGGTVTLDAQNAGANYLWSDATTAQTLVASVTGNYYVDVTSAAGCSASDSILVTINPPVTVTFTTQATACTTDPAFTLTGSPAGGTFSGPGVTGSTFTPATAGAGVQVLTYSYTDANGCSGSANSTITVSACVGVDEPFIAAGMNVYPNPNNGSFTLTIKDADYTEVSMELMTVEGKVVYSDKASNVKGNFVKELDLTQHANGIYFLRVTANGQTFMQKVVKND